MLRFFVLLVLTVAPLAFADSVNKCIDRKGHVIYQSDPCEKAGAEFVKSITANGPETPIAPVLAPAQPKQVRAGGASKSAIEVAPSSYTPTTRSGRAPQIPPTVSVRG